MKAGVLFAQNDIRAVDWPDPGLLPGCVKIRVRACGVCGSDVPRVLGTAAHHYPIILGHEFSGEVSEVAPDVTALAPGERVAGIPLLPCMRCDACQRAQYAQCAHYSFIGSREPGAFAEYIVIPAQNVIKIGPHISFLTGALFEPASVALHGVFRANFSAGEDTVILGAGNIGIFAMQWARLFGARRVAVCDIVPERLDLAASLGADAVFNPLEPDFSAEISRFTDGNGFPYVFETAGQPVTIQLGFELVSNRGALTCVGTPHKDFQFRWEQWELLNRKEFRLTGTWMSYSAPFPGREWHLSARHFENGSLKVHERMIDRRMPLSAIAEAFALYQTPQGVKGKIVIEC